MLLTFTFTFTFGASRAENDKVGLSCAALLAA